jgi:hypothetical protein
LSADITSLLLLLLTMTMTGVRKTSQSEFRPSKLVRAIYDSPVLSFELRALAVRAEHNEHSQVSNITARFSPNNGWHSRLSQSAVKWTNSRAHASLRFRHNALL